jgi:hypothetical protein
MAATGAGPSRGGDKHNGKFAVSSAGSCSCAGPRADAEQEESPVGGAEAIERHGRCWLEKRARVARRMAKMALTWDWVSLVPCN